MAHIPDGLLSAPVLIGGGVVAAVGVAVALRRMDDRAIVRVAILSAVFFTVSLFSVPLGPTSVHLLLAGLMGLMLGPGAFVAVLVGLVLQLLLFGIGGLTTLGVNTVNIALPGVLAGMAFGPMVRRGRIGLAALAGGLSVLGTGALVAASLWLSASEFVPVARVLWLTYLPLAVVEAVVTAVVAGFLARVEPAALNPKEGR
ncbi:cobalt transporter CbiM [Paenirhodobacter sp.]|uniref:cobalt transporter CbiM n=1 Tax=Paenirhodobacter sp. TaxID=1965326 RepID=UPI003B40AFCF